MRNAGQWSGRWWHLPRLSYWQGFDTVWLRREHVSAVFLPMERMQRYRISAAKCNSSTEFGECSPNFFVPKRRPFWSHFEGKKQQYKLQINDKRSEFWRKIKNNDVDALIENGTISQMQGFFKASLSYERQKWTVRFASSFLLAIYPEYADYGHSAFYVVSSGWLSSHRTNASVV